MECNKDEAIRAKEIAERKFISKDAVGALRFVLKARKLYPELDGVQQMIASLNVHVAAADNVSGECDWYKILDVDPKADSETIRGQYMKLAHSLHTDNNRSAGADEAFKLVSQAWSLLSDKAKRTAYEQKRNISTSQEVPTPSGGGAPAPPRSNEFHHSSSNASSSARTDQNNGCAGQDSHNEKPDTFWTYCCRCNIDYEFLRFCANRFIRCPNRHMFRAKERDPPTSNVRRHRNDSDPSQTANQTNAHGGLSSGGASSSAANVSHQGHTKVKRDREEGQASTKREGAIRRKITATKRKGKGIVADGQEKVSGSTGNENGVSGIAGSTALRQGGTEIRPDLSQVLMQKARMEISNNLAEARSEREHNGYKSTGRMDNCEAHTMKKSLRDVGIDVPDPDFHDFNKARAEKSFSQNQIWATYDDSDGMPRRYALIRSVISSDPFKVRISWLIPRTSTQYGLLNWVTSKFPITCGDFTVGGRKIINSINSFSHRVRWTKSSNGDIRILPRKGDVWALYRNWSPDWNERTASEEIHKYDLVEVLVDYDEGLGVAVIPLIKVAGFRSMFHHHMDFGEVRKIPGEKISRLSHYVPSYMHGGREALGALKGCKELDPAATPEELLHVVANAEEVIFDNGVDA